MGVSGRKFIVILMLILAVAIALLVFLQRLALSDQPQRQSGPDVARIAADVPATWSHSFGLPTFLPDCVTYEPGGANIVPMEEARGGTALEIHFVGADDERCDTIVSSDIILTEAPALWSLRGAVTTVSHNQRHFARVVDASTAGGTRIVLQWPCGDIMCRLLAEAHEQGLTEMDLVRMADSVRQVDF